MITEFKKIINEHQHIVFFGGAGVSTESNIPDFRSQNGLYKQRKYPYSPEQMISSTFFWRNPQAFYDFYFNEMVYESALPNTAHKVLAQLEKDGKLDAVITQNIDGLHQLAGSKNVIELHGSIKRNECSQCGTKYSLSDMLAFKGSVPRCGCGGIIKPDVVLYEEPLKEEVINKAIQAIKNADVLIIAGTSLVVYPAAGLIQYFKGDKLILINKDVTSFDDRADVLIHDSIGQYLATLYE